MLAQCTWKPKDDRDVGDAVSWSSSEGAQSDIEEEVQAENCLLLTAPNTASSEFLTVPACQFLLSCQAPDQIVSISILSEAKVLEVYGHHGEYLKTIRNELLEEVEDMSVYRGDITLDRPLQVCSIKFACLQSKNEMWLYGINVRTQKNFNTTENELKIQFSKVEERLQEMDLELSDKAEAFKQLVLCQQNIAKFEQQDLNNFVHVLRLLNLTKQRYALPGSESSVAFNPHQILDSVKLDVSNLASPGDANIVKLPSKEVNDNEISTRQSFGTQTDHPPPKNDFDLLKEYIDGKFDELSTNVWDKVQKRLEEIEAKVLCKLDEIEVFVKPQGVPNKT